SGKTIGRCRIGRPIGRGASATVFHAAYLPLKRDVAVKILRPDAAADAEARQRFVEEARALAKLDHPGIVRVFDVVEDGGLLLIIMDFVEGRNLRQVVDEDGAMDPEEALQAAKQVAEALDHAHAQGILHRDVKPANVILDPAGRAVLVDFGNAEKAGGTGDRKGTAHYVAPEVFQGKKQDEKTDTYSLGATLFHLLAGSPPHEGSTVKQILQAHEEGKIRAPSQVNPEAGIPKEVDQLVKRAMAPARGYRFLAREFAAAVEEALPSLQGAPGRTRGRRIRSRTPGRSPRSSQPNYAVIGGVALLLIAAGVAAMVASSGKETPPPEPPKKKEEAVAPVKPPEEPGHIDPGFDQRASGRAARDAAAAKAMKEAEDFAALHADRPKEAAEKFAAVASEYAELAVGRRAKEEQKRWAELSLSADERGKRDAELQEMARREKEMRAESLRKCEEFVGRMLFAEALGALDEASPAGAGVEEWKRRRERLNLLIGFSEAIGSDLEGNPVPVQKIRYDFGRLGEKVTEARAEGLTLTGTGGARQIPWSELKPADILALCRQVMRSSGEHRLMLAAFCWEAGLKDEGRKEMDTALLTDRTGTVSGRIEELFGPEDQR
ncbi:MAG: protein kinase, partial [Planctomycetes bacterium]|nr:protein kinase [Planctomycetota bacterium]